MSDSRILTTHTGSLPRPAELTRLYARRARGESIDEAMLAREGSKAVPWIVQQQIAAGLDVINNGEQQRESFVLYLRRRLSGLGGEGSRPPWADVEAYPKYKENLSRQIAARGEAVSNRDSIPKCIGPIVYQGQTELAAECDDFTSALTAMKGRYTEAFFTAPSPGILATIVQNAHYTTFSAYLDAITKAVAIEYKRIVEDGFVLQLDCPDLALERHGLFQNKSLAEFQAFVEEVIDAINRAIAGLPRDRIRLHVCWGNYEGPHDKDVALADILPILMRANVGGFVLPFANPRHAHEWKLFAKHRLADDQCLVAGVIDTLTNFVEHPEVVADRLERIAEVVGDPRRVLAGTDCGFDTSAGMGRVAEDIVWAKLRAMSDGAALASKRLF
ncbi:MAG: cobalamin-independent methionine synthase II family protein [Hyphomicrobiaceae bacterium]